MCFSPEIKDCFLRERYASPVGKSENKYIFFHVLSYEKKPKRDLLDGLFFSIC